MRLLDRYLLRELLLPLAFCLCGFVVVFITMDLFNQLNDFRNKGLSGAEVAEYYLVTIPDSLATILPVALLLALLYTLTNHARYNEITAIRAAGVSLWRLSAPYFAVGFAASLALAALSEFWLPDVDQRADRILNRHAAGQSAETPGQALRNFGFTNGRDRRTWQIGRYDPARREMTDPKVDWNLPDGSHRELIAQRAIWTNQSWTFYGVLENTYAPDGTLTNRFLPTNAVSRTAFNETPEIIQSEIKISARLGRRLGKKADLPLVEIFDYLRLHPDLDAKDAAWLHTRLQTRLADPWRCVVVVLIALPFGAASGRRNVFVGVASSIAIGFTYFVCQQMSTALGSGGHLPPWLAAWAPNLLAATLGIWLILRVR
jgi:lipopolysaccharide export system permease protein